MIRDPMPTHSELEVLLFDQSDSRQAPRVRIVCPGVLVAGRMPTSHLVLPREDVKASKMHFQIELMPSFCRLTNYSDRGTLVNGLLVETQCDLRHGDLVRAGRSTFHAEIRRRGVPARLDPAPTIVPLAPDLTDPLTQPTPAAPAAGPPVPVVPGYRVLCPVGSGGMGTVWLAEDAAGQRVACKVIRPELALDPESCARFRREANHLRDLSHRHVVGFREAGEHGGSLYLVMEYVPGKNLADLLVEQGPFAVARAVRLTCQVLEALNAAHGSGVVHRDVKPSNVLVQPGPDGEEEARLADFGLAKPYQGDGVTVTQPGTRGGTLAFAAPEMVADFRRANIHADQYGAAATLYNLLTGRHLYDAANAVDLWTFIRDQDPVPLSRRRHGLPEGLVNAVHRALAREPAARYGTVLVFRDALAPYVSG
jgi:serine/threonine protein kinase